MKLEFSRQIFEKSTQIQKFHENPFQWEPICPTRTDENIVYNIKTVLAQQHLSKFASLSTLCDTPKLKHLEELCSTHLLGAILHSPSPSCVLLTKQPSRILTYNGTERKEVLRSFAAEYPHDHLSVSISAKCREMFLGHAARSTAVYCREKGLALQSRVIRECV